SELNLQIGRRGPPGTVPHFGTPIFSIDLMTSPVESLARASVYTCCNAAGGIAAALIYVSHVSWGFRRRGRGRSGLITCTSGLVANHTCVISRSHSNKILVAFTKKHSVPVPRK